MSKLPLKTRLGFGVGDLGGNLYFTFIGFYLLFFLTDLLGLSPALAGTTLMIGKIWDAVTDPVTGYVSDRTISPMGRRRPYMVAGSVICFISMYLLFSISPTESQNSLFIKATLYFCLLSTGYTLINIPYTALLPELSRSYDERTILTAYRMSFAVIGTFAGAAAVMPLVGLFSDSRRGWAGTAAILGTIIAVTALITVAAVREPKHRREDVKGEGFIRTYIQALGTKVFLLALIPWTLFIAGTSMVQGVLLYYFKYIFGNEGLFQIALVGLLTTSLLFIPFWVRISKRLSKKSCYNIGMGIMTAGVMLFSFTGGVWSATAGIIIITLAGIGLSTHYVMPFSILPDVVEYDSVHHGGIRREGAYSSLWTFASKIGQALALAMSGWLLQFFGYVPEQAQSSRAILGIKLISGPFPALFYIIGILILYRFPCNREYSDRMIGSGKGST
ncbi:MAG: MFS transporter [Spirochaetales bacterium]|nr:MFS transporter [Spirochaetales bacterium]